MPAKKRSRTTLRIATPLYDEVTRLADETGMDINGALGLLVHLALPALARLAAATKHSRSDAVAELAAWLETNPSRHVNEFLETILNDPPMESPPLFGCPGWRRRLSPALVATLADAEVALHAHARGILTEAEARQRIARLLTAPLSAPESATPPQRGGQADAEP